MPLRQHRGEDGTLSEARFSRCGRYRYSLSRTWEQDRPPQVWILLNPSTADEGRNDPTLSRIEARARSAGAGGLVVVNLFGLRATDPRQLRQTEDPVGPGNDAAIRSAVRDAQVVHCGWGCHGARFGREETVLRLLRCGGAELRVLGLTRDGAPRHPLYLPGSALPRAWDPPNRGDAAPVR